MPKVKSAGKVQAKASTKITIALPDALLEWADLLADVQRLERNDIIRQALADGLVLLQARRLALPSTDPSLKIADEYSDQVGGIEGFKQKIVKSMIADEAELRKRAGNN